MQSNYIYILKLLELKRYINELRNIWNTNKNIEM